MLYYIKGVMEESSKDYIIIDNNGIGYKIFVSNSTLSKLSNSSGQIKVYTYFHVREDIMALYGFLTKEELDMFELLISVSGVGPKAGLAVLSVLTPQKLCLSIIGGDSKSLITVPGIGSKTANRIILELKDKVESSEIIKIGYIDEFENGNPVGEAVNALIALGYSLNEASSAVRNIDNCSTDTEKIIKAALKMLMK